MNTVRDLFSKWPDIGAVAGDLGVPYVTAHKMAVRNSVPAKYWSRLVESAQQRAIDGIDLEKLAAMAETRQPAVSGQ